MRKQLLSHSCFKANQARFGLNAVPSFFFLIPWNPIFLLLI